MSGKVLGLDLSITAAGICPDDQVTETVGGDARLGDERLVLIRNRVRTQLRRISYDLAVVEGPGFQSTRLFSVAMVHGAVRAELVVAQIPIALVYPTTLHAFACGGGSATKVEMVQAAEGLSGRKFRDDNQADAWWLWRMGRAALGDHTGLNPDQVERLGRVKWPRPCRPFLSLTDGHPRVKVDKCRHEMWSLRNGDRWVHPYTLDVCDKPPK